MSYRETRNIRLPNQRDLRKARYQIIINNYFFKIVEELANEIVDSANEFTRKKYGRYASFGAIRIARERLKAIGDTLGIDDI